MRLAERTVLNASSKIASDLSYLVVSLESSESAASLWVYSVSLEQGPHWLCLPQTATYLINRVLSPQGHGLLMNLTVKQGPCCLRQIWHSFSASLQQAQMSPPAAYLCTCPRQCDGGCCLSYLSEEEQLFPGWVCRVGGEGPGHCPHCSGEIPFSGTSQVDQEALFRLKSFFFFNFNIFNLPFYFNF